MRQAMLRSDASEPRRPSTCLSEPVEVQDAARVPPPSAPDRREPKPAPVAVQRRRSNAHPGLARVSALRSSASLIGLLT
jgi:hypothetical protein